MLWSGCLGRSAYRLIESSRDVAHADDAGKAEIIVCANNFHGRTVTIVSFSSDEQYRDGFGPFTPGFKIIPYGNAMRAQNVAQPCAAEVTRHEMCEVHDERRRISCRNERHPADRA